MFFLRQNLRIWIVVCDLKHQLGRQSLRWPQQSRQEEDEEVDLAGEPRVEVRIRVEVRGPQTAVPVQQHPVEIFDDLNLEGKKN